MIRGEKGEPGNEFFMIEDGELYAEKSKNPGDPGEIVFTYKAGDYFGEIALLQEVPRQASVICKVK